MRFIIKLIQELVIY